MRPGPFACSCLEVKTPDLGLGELRHSQSLTQMVGKWLCLVEVGALWRNTLKMSIVLFSIFITFYNTPTIESYASFCRVADRPVFLGPRQFRQRDMTGHPPSQPGLYCPPWGWRCQMRSMAMRSGWHWPPCLVGHSGFRWGTSWSSWGAPLGQSVGTALQ